MQSLYTLGELTPKNAGATLQENPTTFHSSDLIDSAPSSIDIQNLYSQASVSEPNLLLTPRTYQAGLQDPQDDKPAGLDFRELAAFFELHPKSLNGCRQTLDCLPNE